MKRSCGSFLDSVSVRLSHLLVHVPYARWAIADESFPIAIPLDVAHLHAPRARMGVHRARGSVNDTELAAADGLLNRSTPISRNVGQLSRFAQLVCVARHRVVPVGLPQHNSARMGHTLEHA